MVLSPYDPAVETIVKGTFPLGPVMVTVAFVKFAPGIPKDHLGNVNV
jgi:hypothetical protein